MYANQGADLFLGARRVEKLNNVKEECVRRGAGRVTTVSCDVSREGDCKKFIEQVVVGDEDNGGKGIDVLILNAGVGQVITRCAINVIVLVYTHCLQSYRRFTWKR